jgi:hypothetical protein
MDPVARGLVLRHGLSAEKDSFGEANGPGLDPVFHND